VDEEREEERPGSAPGRGSDASRKKSAKPKPSMIKPKPKPSMIKPKAAPSKIKAKAKPKAGAKPRPKSKAKKGAGAPKAAGTSFGKALKQGATETRSRSKGVPSRLGTQVLAVAGRLFAIFFDVLGIVIVIVAAVAFRVAKPVAAGLRILKRIVESASRMVTPVRALTVVVAGAAVLLALSQFADYRGVSIGTDNYADVATIAPAPERERSETGSAHGYMMVPVALICLGLLVAAVRGRRWQLCRLIALGGAVAIAVALIIDRPAGLDPGELDVVYVGVKANLLGGFYAQLFAGMLLVASSLLLSREIRLAGDAAPARKDRRETSSRRAPRATKAQGARA